MIIFGWIDILKYVPDLSPVRPEQPWRIVYEKYRSLISKNAD